MKTHYLRNGFKRMAGAAAVVLLAMGVLASQDASAQIGLTKHNLGTGRVTGTLDGTRTNEFSGTGEICVFCHTPHGADASAAVPLWNRTLAAPTNYTTYNSLGTSSLDGATAPVGSVSLACLSCHDGAQAMNTIINQPGSGLVVTSYGAGVWSGTRQTAGALTGAANLGVVLNNDHPIGIQYAGGPSSTIPAAPAAYPNTAFKDADFKGASSASLNGMSVWWVDTESTPNATRQKTDMQLYTRTDASSVARDGTVTASAIAGAQPFVECASCHDPHTNANATFLRVSNANSAVCLACHIK